MQPISERSLTRRDSLNQHRTGLVSLIGHGSLKRSDPLGEQRSGVSSIATRPAGPLASELQ